jgi:hypothetical protein
VILTCVVSVHDASVVEHDVETTPGIQLLDSCGNISLLAHVAHGGFDLAGSVRDNLLDLGKSLLESRCRDIAHQNRCTLTSKKNGGLETDATTQVLV